MSSDPEFDAAIRDAGARIGDILREDMDSQRQKVHAQIRAMLEVARTKVGGELAAALLEVLTVADRWQADALTYGGRTAAISNTAAANEILTAIETGLGVRQ